MVKRVNFGTKSAITAFFTHTPTEVTIPLDNTIQVCDASNGEYDLIVDGLLLNTPLTTHQPAGDPPGREKGTAKFQAIIKTDGISSMIKGNSCHTGVNPTFGTQNPDALIGALTFNKIAAGGTIGYKPTFSFNWRANAPATDEAIPVITVPFTITDPLKAPLGCTNTSADNSFCVSPTNARTFAEFPEINSKTRDAYAQVYRYSLFIHNFGGPSGEAELKGNDLAVALGNGFGLAWNNHDGGTRHEQSSTLAHELLHTVNYLHGGPNTLINDITKLKQLDSAKNCKPYPGVDKYNRQIPDIYLTLLTADRTTDLPTGGIHDDVHATSEWKLEYSDGTHGSSARDVILDPGHITAIG